MVPSPLRRKPFGGINVVSRACKENGVIFANCDDLYDDYPNLWDPDGIHFRKEFYPHWARYLLVATLMEE